MLSLTAPAKVNLTLEVVGKRPDGYHEIRSLLQTIDLQDTITFELAESVHFSCNVPELETEDNLVLKAVRLVQKEASSSQGVSLELTKVIPQAAGLGGGSSDAATTLIGLNRLWGLNLPFSVLHGLAAKLGSDVPFFLFGGIAEVQGRGEQVKPLPPLPDTWFVLLKPSLPPMSGKTGQLYRSLNPSYFSDGQHTRQAVKLLQQGQRIEPEVLFNVFETVVFGLFPRLEDYRQHFLACDASWVRLAGSGPCLFTLTWDEISGERIYSQLRQKGLECYLVSSLNAIIRDGEKG